MSVDVSSGTERGLLTPPVALPNWGLRGRRRRRLSLAPGISEARGPAASLRRDTLFRRMLLMADGLAIVGAFVLTVELSHRDAGLTPFCLAALPILIGCAKMSGLYDRD